MTSLRLIFLLFPCAATGAACCTAWLDACAGTWLSSAWYHHIHVAFSPGSLSSSAIFVNTHVHLDAFRWVSCPSYVSGHVWLTATQARCRVPIACVSYRSLFMCLPFVSPCISIFFLGTVPYTLVVSCGCVSCSGSLIAGCLCHHNPPCLQVIICRFSFVLF